MTKAQREAKAAYERAVTRHKRVVARLLDLRCHGETWGYM
jgi:hypothetical protein